MSEDTSVEMIVPPNTLKDKVPVSGTGEPDMTAVVRAEKALDLMSVEFDDWLAEEVEKLLIARDLVQADGLNDETSEKLYMASHDLKGQGETYGYPLITQVCASLCKLLDTAPQHSDIPTDIIDHHVNAVRNMMKLKMKLADDPQGSAVANKLIDVVLEYAAYEDKKKKQQETEAA